jgi:hypothetical protein
LKQQKETGKIRQNVLLLLFNKHVPAADIEASLAIADMDNYGTDVFVFQDFQLVDSDYRVLATGAGADYIARARTDCRFIKFTLVANPRDINAAGMNVDATLFPSPVMTTVYL